METPVARPLVYEYLSYREFLEDFVVYLRFLGDYSDRSFAKKAGLGSASHVRLCIQGKKNTSSKVAYKIGKALELDSNELKYFLELVKFTQAKTPPERETAYREVTLLRSRFLRKQLGDEELQLYSQWYTIAVRELLKLESMTEEKISRSLGIKVEEVRRSTQALESLGFIEKRGRKWNVIHDALDASPPGNHRLVRSFHREMIAKALEAIDELPAERRQNFGLTMPLSAEQYEEAMRDVSEFVDELSAKFSTEPSAEQVYQLNFQMFPLLKEPLDR